MSDSLYRGTVRTVGETMAKSVTNVRDFKIFMDQPPEMGGGGSAPSPLDFILAAHSGCLNFMTFAIAKELGIPVEGTDITISAALDPGKIAGTEDTTRAGYQAFEITIEIKSPAAPEEVERLRREVEQRCPISDNISNSTPVNITMHAVA